MMEGSNAITCPCCHQPVPDAGLLCDDLGHTITNGEKTIRLTHQQYRLAKYLIDRFPATATKDDIYSSVFMDAVGDGPDLKIIDVIICKIRPAMAEVGLCIETLWGTGYRLVEERPEKANAIVEAGIRSTRRGAYRWTPEDDAQLLELIGRKMKVTACAAIMRKPFMTVERNYKRLAGGV